MDVVTALRCSRMSLGRWGAVLLCVLCNVIDGLDLLLASFALPHFPAAFATAEEKGFLISLGFAGMAFGSIFIGPLADRIGRKNLIVASLLVSTISLAVTAASPWIQLVLLMRFLTGIGVGTVTPLSFVLADEYASESRRSVCVGIVALGYPIGSTVGGMIGLFIINSFGGAWQALFLFGAAISFIVFLVALAFLPESLTFLVGRAPHGADARIARIAARMGLTDVDPAAVPATVEPAASTDTKVGVLAPRYRRRTWIIWIGYATSSTAFYFVTSWTPQLVSTASGSTATGTLVGTILSVGGFVATIVFIVIVTRVAPTKVSWVAGIIACVAQVAFALTLANGAAIAAAALLGMSLQAVQSAYVASCTRIFPTLIRARAEGLMMGISRVGTILVPLLVGYILSVISPQTMYLSASVFVFIATGAALMLWLSTRRELVPSGANASFDAPFAEATPSGQRLAE
ncbi:MFS transporter [Sinomonas terrae]|uniref:MFS transporter n=1 Tax=Sinomonas terrae TaxID=2908838 RepID=A0ABS9U1Z1_9MICC|nr:MFS transporter [Sinomonas terrae]MCH6470714.1 MFS transporter [Sinomonas terrae]